MSQQPWSSQKHGDNLWAESGWSKCRICWTCAAYLVLNYKTTKRKSKVWFNTLQVCSMFHRPLGRWRSHLGGTGVGMRAMPFPSGPKDEVSMPYLSHKYLVTTGSPNSPLETQKLKRNPSEIPASQVWIWEWCPWANQQPLLQEMWNCHPVSNGSPALFPVLATTRKRND